MSYIGSNVKQYFYLLSKTVTSGILSFLDLSVQRVVSWSKRSKSACFTIIAQFCVQENFETLYRAIVPFLKMGRLSQYLPSHK